MLPPAWALQLSWPSRSAASSRATCRPCGTAPRQGCCTSCRDGRWSCRTLPGAAQHPVHQHSEHGCSQPPAGVGQAGGVSRGCLPHARSSRGASMSPVLRGWVSAACVHAQAQHRAAHTGIGCGQGCAVDLRCGCEGRVDSSTAGTAAAGGHGDACCRELMAWTVCAGVLVGFTM